MSLETVFIKELNGYSKILKELAENLKYDPLEQSCFQCYRQEEYREIYLYLKNFELNELILKGQFVQAPKKAFFHILNYIKVIIDEIDSKVHKIDAFDFIYLYEKVLLPMLFDREITSALNDLKFVENQGRPSWMTIDRFKIELEYWKTEIKKVENEKHSYRSTNSNLIKNYYYLLKDLLQEARENIYVYYPEERLQHQSDIFEIDDVLKLYDSALKLECFEKEDLAFEDFYFIVNLRKPKSSFKKELKQKTKFAGELPLLFEKCDTETKMKVIHWLSLKLNTAESTLKSYCHKQNESI